MDRAITKALLSQYSSGLSMLHDAIAAFPEEAWAVGDRPSTTPAWLSYHALETVDFYAGKRSEGFEWGAVGGDWEDLEAAPPTRDEILAYSDRVVERVSRWLQDPDPEGWSGPDLGFTWFPDRLTRALYSLRHLEQAIGELNGMLKRRGAPPAAWR
jgi:hypothetical protein